MHYAALLFTENLPNEQDIAETMKPYSWDNLKYDDEDKLIGEYPVFTYDYYVIGGRYKAAIKLSVEGNEDYYGWKYYSMESRNGRLFWSCMLSKMKEHIKPGFLFSEEDYFMNIGFGDGFLYVDGARSCDILNYEELESYICIDSDGSAIAQSSWNGTEFIEDKDYDAKSKALLKKHKNGFVTMLDIHD